MIFVNAITSISPGVERRSHRLDRLHHNIMWRERVEPSVQLPQIRVVRAIKVRHLPERMNTRIGAPRTLNLHAPSQEDIQGVFEHPLDRGTLGLYLPTTIVRPFVFNDQPDIHEIGILNRER